MAVEPTVTRFLVTMTGSTPLVMDRMAGDDEPATKEIKTITSKGGNMTPEDLRRKDTLQYHSRLYQDQGLLVMPWANIFRAMRSGAALISTRTASQIGGLAVSAVNLPLLYGGPSLDKLFADPGFQWRTMVNGNPTGKKAMVPTVRPVFGSWGLEFPLTVFNEVIGEDTARRVLDITGQAIGIGNARKLGYGRFACEFKPLKTA